MIERQRAERGWKGCLITNPNCAAIGIVMALKPLHDAAGTSVPFLVLFQVGFLYVGAVSLFQGRSIARRTPPAAAMWLFLIKTPSERSRR